MEKIYVPKYSENDFPPAYYDAKSVCFFKKTKEEWGEFSNMCAGFPIKIGDVKFPSSEYLYQCLKYSGNKAGQVQCQLEIMRMKSPMTAAKKARRINWKQFMRDDWDKWRIDIMLWVQIMKLTHNFEKLSKILLATGKNPIVEWSKKDDFWGAKLDEKGEVFLGQNVLGNLLMTVRDKYVPFYQQNRIPKLVVPKFPECIIFGKNLSEVVPKKGENVPIKETSQQQQKEVLKLPFED